MTVASNCTSASEKETIVSTNVSASIPVNQTNSVFKFTKPIKLGSKGIEVLELQKKLNSLGFYTGKIDGLFGATTEKAVKALQKAHKLTQIGSVGPSTRALLNK